MLPMHKILVPTDFSGPSASALAVAASLAREGGGRVILLHVLTERHGAVETGSELRERLEEEAGRFGSVQIETQTAWGDAAGEIVGAARENGCDLIVMGTHGRTGLRRLLMGSVAEGVARKAPCSVLTVRATAGHDAVLAGELVVE